LGFDDCNRFLNYSRACAILHSPGVTFAIAPPGNKVISGTGAGTFTTSYGYDPMDRVITMT
jgi:hypothetical protein